MEGDRNINVDTSKADRSVWLMKCPPIVSKAWQSAAASASAHSAPVAKVVVTLDLLRPQDPPAYTMVMAGSDVENMPKSYSLNMFKDFVPMVVFSETNQGRVAMEGKIENKFDMKPHHENIDDYSKVCRERTNLSNVKNRQVQVISGVVGRSTPTSTVGRSTPTSKDIKRKPPPPKGPDMKRTRMDRGDLEDIMFKLFERQPNWTKSRLVEETDQPEQFMKEILNELCVYNKRGANQGTYELKPEYKKSVEDAGAE